MNVAVVGVVEIGGYLGARLALSRVLMKVGLKAPVGLDICGEIRIK